jgi:hypothetical protein
MRGHGASSKDAELLVAREEVEVLRRQIDQPDLLPTDQVVLAALSQLQPRSPARRQWLLPPGHRQESYRPEGRYKCVPIVVRLSGGVTGGRDGGD